MDSRGVLHLGRDSVADDQRSFAVSVERLAELGWRASSWPIPWPWHAGLPPDHPARHDGDAWRVQRGAGPRAVAENHDQPIVLALSNPSSASEAMPSDILAWTDGRALIATGSPFPDVEIGGVRRLIGQANNVFIFPGVGLGAMVAEARELTDEAFLVAARKLAELVGEERLAAGAVYPPIPELRVAARAIAIELVRHFRDTGYGRQYTDDEVERVVDRAMWWPDYLPFEPLPEAEPR